MTSPGGGRSDVKQAPKRLTNRDSYFRKQVRDPGMRRLVEEELKALRVGTETAGRRRASVRGH